MSAKIYQSTFPDVFFIVSSFFLLLFFNWCNVKFTECIYYLKFVQTQDDFIADENGSVSNFSLSVLVFVYLIAYCC